MRSLAFIPARCGSKSIPEKNIKIFYGKPLIYWSLKAASDASEIDEIIVATDCEKIESIVKSFNFPKIKIYRRSSENAQDTSSTESVILEFLNQADCQPEDFFILIQGTSPFTTSLQLNEALIQAKEEKSDSVMSCATFKRFIWNSEGVSLNYDFLKRPRRQDFNDNFIENGAFYISKVKNILKSGNRISGKISLFQMPEYTHLELDEEFDWVIGEALMARYSKETKINVSEIKLFLSDIDGVLTDAGMYYSENGDELKKFNTYDGMGFKLLNERGIKTGLISGEDRELNHRRFKKMKLDYFYGGVDDKLKIVKDLCKELKIGIENVAFIGDDINDKEVLMHVGFPACPSSAQDEIKAIHGIYNLQKSGGSGVIREFANIILSNGK